MTLATGKVKSRRKPTFTPRPIKTQINDILIKVTDVRIAPELECWEWNGKRYPTLQVGYLVDGKGERRCSDFAAESLWRDMLSAYEAENNVVQKDDIG